MIDFGLLHSIATVAAMVAFFAIAWWAYAPKNKARFDEAAKLALDEEIQTPTQSQNDATSERSAKHKDSAKHKERLNTEGDTRS